MIKLNAGIVSAGLLTLASLPSCASADTPDEETSASASVTMGAPTGSAPGPAPTGGPAPTPSTPPAGTPPPAGAGGTPSVNPPGCQGISTGEACTVPGTSCPTLVCGIADSGSRSCNCTTTWECTSCDYTNSPFKDRPANIGLCGTIEKDKVLCTTQGAACEGAPGGEVCICYSDDEGDLIWDCDNAPSTWAP